MKRLKKHRSQRQKAIRRLRWTIPLLLLFVLLGMIPLNSFSPTQAIRSAECFVGVEETNRIAEKKIGSVAFYFTENENVLMLTSFRFSLLPSRWNTVFPELLLDRTKETGPLSAAGMHRYSDEDGWHFTQIIGTTTLEDAVSIKALDPEYPDGPFLTGPIFQAENGTRWFWLCAEEPWPEDEYYCCDRICALDQDGNVLYTYDSTNWSSGTY